VAAVACIHLLAELERPEQAGQVAVGILVQIQEQTEAPEL
jgi:hypothetical protein